MLTEALRGTAYADYTLSCQTFAVQYGEPGNGSAYAIATGDGQNVLCAFVESEGSWQLRVANEHALPDGSAQFSITVSMNPPLVVPAVVITAETAGGNYQLQFVIDSGDPNAPYSWPLFDMTYTASGASGGALSTVLVAPNEETGKWTITDNGVYQSYEDHAYARMAEFDLRDIPLSRAAADAMWHGTDQTVFIERDDRATAEGLHKLAGREVTLPGDQTIPVYSGPGENHLRGANGKAAVSTNEPITLYATDGDWALISYGVSTGDRFGYIAKRYVPADDSADHTLTGSISVGLTTREVAVLDNLSDPDASLCVLPYQTPLEVFATLGDWLYIGTFAESGLSCRGFIPIDAFHHTNTF